MLAVNAAMAITILPRRPLYRQPISWIRLINKSLRYWRKTAAVIVGGGTSIGMIFENDDSQLAVVETFDVNFPEHAFKDPTALVRQYSKRRSR